MCGGEEGDSYGIALCSGEGHGRYRGNHIASASHDADNGTMLFGCDGGNAWRMRIWIR